MRFVLDQDVDARVVVFLRCNEWDGITVVKQHLDTILPVLERKPELWIKLSLGTEPEYSLDWN